MKIFSVCALLLSLSCGLFASSNYDEDRSDRRAYDANYYNRLAYCKILCLLIFKDKCAV